MSLELANSTLAKLREHQTVPLAALLARVGETWNVREASATPRIVTARLIPA